MFTKNSQDLDDFKKKREDFSFNIRRNNRQDFFNKRRNIGETQNADQLDSNQNIVDLQFCEEIKKMHNETFYLENIQQYAQMINSSDYLTKIRGVIALRKTIDGERQQTFNHFLASDLVTKFIGFLSKNNEPQVTLEAVLLFSSLSYGSGVCHILVKLEIVKPLLQLLIENQLYIVDQALICLGNISADHEDLRDIILNHSALEILYQLLSKYHRSSTYLNAIWTITNLCRGKNPPTHPLIDSAVSVLCKETKNKELQNLENPEVSKVMQDILATFSLLSQRSKSRSDRIIQGDVLPLIFNFALSQTNSHVNSAIRIIGNFAHQGEYQTQALISNGIFDLSLKLLKSPKKVIRRQICWILSNIAAGVVSQVNKFLDRHDVIEKLVELIKSDVLQVKHQIAWVFPNLGHLGDKSRVMKLFEQTDIMRLYIDLLGENSPQFLSDVLKCILKILMVGNKSLVEGNNLMLVKFMEYGGTEKVDKLQFHESSAVYKAAVSIITKFFDVEEAS